MSTHTATMPLVPPTVPRMVDPSVYAERLLSREAMERVHLPEADLLGLRNVATGELVCVLENSLRRWMQRCS